MPDKPPSNPRPAQPEGKTLLQYSPNGRKLIVAGLANFVRTYNTGDEDNVVIVDGVPDETNALIAGNDYFITGNEDGLVSEFDIVEKKLDKLIVRSSLPIRALALTPDQDWIAVASDEVIVKVVSRHDIEQIKILRDHPKIIKHLSYDPAGKYLAASCINGIIYVYSLAKGDGEESRLLRIVDGIIRRLDVEDDATSECVWHPDGRAFACATATREIATVSVADGAQQRSFVGGHMADILSLAWSANGALLASTSRDGTLVLWETKTQSIIKKFEFEKILKVTWHPQAENYLNWTNSWGEVVICPDFLGDESHVRLLKGPSTRSPFFHDPLDENSTAITTNTTGGRPLVNGNSNSKPLHRGGTPDSLDILLDDNGDDEDQVDIEEEGENWIEDDDGAGYTNINGKRPNGIGYNHNGNVNSKRLRPNATTGWGQPPRLHPPFQPGSTPWRGNRRYLCLNLTGFVWTIDQDKSRHHTVTVEFYDRDSHRDFHFTDPYLYDKACLNEKGALFSCPPSQDSEYDNANGGSGGGEGSHPSCIFYRPHETWTTGRADWRTELPPNENVVAMALSDNFVTVVTTRGYVRVYTLFGTPYRIWRHKGVAGSVVACAAHGDYVMIVSNGSVGPDGRTSQLLYSIEDVRKDVVCQDGDVVPLVGQAPSLRNVFFSDDGDPHIYDSTGTLLLLLHWRQPLQAKWVPLLDTTQLSRLASGRKEESYWPVAVARAKFHCIILKGGDRYPSFPRPLLSEFEFKVPVFSAASAAVAATRRTRLANGGPGSDDDDDDDDDDEDGEGIGGGKGRNSIHADSARLEESLVRSSIICSLLEDHTKADADADANGNGNGNGNKANKHRRAQQLSTSRIEMDKILLQLLAVECRAGEERGMKALEIFRLMRTEGSRGVNVDDDDDDDYDDGYHRRKIEAAARVAARWGRSVLEEKIRRLGERRLLGFDDDGDDDSDGDGDVGR